MLRQCYTSVSAHLLGPFLVLLMGLLPAGPRFCSEAPLECHAGVGGISRRDEQREALPAAAAEYGAAVRRMCSFLWREPIPPQPPLLLSADRRRGE